MRESAQTTVRQAVINLMRSYGMTTIFGNPGSTELPMFRDLPDDFRYVLGLQESVALGMADGYAEATHNAAMVNLHSAIGVGHAMGGIFTAFRSRTPLVIIAGQQARSMLAGEPYLYSEDATLLPRPYVKWSREPSRAEDVPLAIARAYHVAMSPPMGPTLVSVPADDWDRLTYPVPIRSVSRTVRADPQALKAVGDALAAAANPALVVGAAVAQDGAFDAAVRLAEMHQAAVWAQPMSSRCSFPESHPLFAGFLPPTRTGIVERLTGHDVVVVLGAPVFTYHVETLGPHVPEDVDVYQLTDDPHQAAWTPVGTSVVTSMAPGIEALLALPPARRRSAPLRRPVPPLVSSDGLVTSELLIQTLARLRPADSVIVEEAPSTRPVMCQYLPNDEPESFFTCTSGGLGYSLPAAVGMLLARPDRRVIAVLGDGASMYSVQALWSAAQLGEVPMTIIVVNNGSYATLHNFARMFGIGKAVGSDLPGLDFVGLATAQGCQASRVDTSADLESALCTALTATAPYLLEVNVV
jgi:benzoylformate decarboxylase